MDNLFKIENGVLLDYSWKDKKIVIPDTAFFEDIRM